MKKLIDNIKKLFKVYSLLSSNSITIDLNRLGLEKGAWYFVTIIAKRTDSGCYMDQMALFQFTTKQKAKKIEKKLRAHYKQK